MAMDLESETPPEPVAAPAAPEPPAPPAEPPDPDESQAIEFQGGKMVPLDALKAARQEAKDLKARAGENDQLRQQVAHLQGTLQTYQQVQQQIASAQQQQAPQQPAVSDPELVELARSLDYYKGDGTPDLDRAAKFSAIIDKKAESKARQMVQPIQDQSAQEASLRNFQAALQEKAPNGMAIDQMLLKTFWQGLPPNMTADPRVARVVASMVLGEQLRATVPQPPPPLHPPLVTEPVGGSPPQRRAPISEAERKVLEHRGMTDTTYAAHTKDFRTGRLNTLED